VDGVVVFDVVVEDWLAFTSLCGAAEVDVPALLLLFSEEAAAPVAAPAAAPAAAPVAAPELLPVDAALWSDCDGVWPAAVDCSGVVEAALLWLFRSDGGTVLFWFGVVVLGGFCGLVVD
jgi:hypothetical protein